MNEKKKTINQKWAFELSRMAHLGEPFLLFRIPAQAFEIKIYESDGMGPQHAFEIKISKKRLVAGSDSLVRLESLRIRLDYSLRSPVCRRRRPHCRSSWLQQITIHWRQTWEFIAMNNGDRREKVAGITKSERNACTPVTNNIAFFSFPLSLPIFSSVLYLFWCAGTCPMPMKSNPLLQR